MRTLLLPGSLKQNKTNDKTVQKQLGMEKVELIFTSPEVMHLPEYGSCVSSIHLLC